MFTWIDAFYEFCGRFRTMKVVNILISVLAPVAIGLLVAPRQNSTDYKSSVEAWRKQQEDTLKAPRGWLSVAGLYWLTEGENVIGSATGSDVLLPSSAPAKVGVLVRIGKKVTLRAIAGSGAKINGKAVSRAGLAPDTMPNYTRVTVGDMVFNVIVRGDRIGLRLYDPNCRGRKEFKGLLWYPVSEKYQVKAKFVAYNPPKPMRILNVLGDTRETVSPGYAEFELGGVLHRIDAEDAGEGLFFNFKDATSGHGTYPAGRFLDSDKPVGGYVILDFNKATNPPCAFTAFATCPLPPLGNNIDVAVLAGEKNYHLE